MENLDYEATMRDVLETTELADDGVYYHPSFALAIASCVKELEANGFGLVPKRGTVMSGVPFEIRGSDGIEVVGTGCNAESIQLFFRDDEMRRTFSVTIADER